ncbi:hypothetical protein GCM10007304_49830 [Rhodococcoides trifolii]|uniref:NAD-dependent epimerase/dehydratase domain-containing protein n=1 Tax=Rhodococcoides trifolii TaxID=908250 RepID=A0A917LJG8_9NOCA|nr:hypothetical protein GCM10007304_49830 [Rhodococcus trifolii]
MPDGGFEDGGFEPFEEHAAVVAELLGGVLERPGHRKFTQSHESTVSGAPVFLLSMKLLVTGGAGFIGANFVHQTLATRPDAQITVLDALTYAGNEESVASVRDTAGTHT